MRRNTFYFKGHRTRVLAAFLLVGFICIVARRSEAQDAADKAAALSKAAAAREARDHFAKGQQMEASGNANGAVDEYLNALRKDPSALGSNVYRLAQVVHRTDRVDELVETLEAIDVASFGQYHRVSNFYQYLMNFEERHDAAMKILGLAWNAFPNDRIALLQMVHREKIWERPELIEYAREALIPKPEQVAANPWIAMQSITSYGSDGKAYGIVTRLVAAAVEQNKLDDLAEQFSTHLQQNPEWGAGHALMAVFEVKHGDIDKARRRIEQLLDNQGAVNTMPVTARWLLSQELDGVDSLNDLSLRLLEDSREELLKHQQQFSYSPARLLRHLTGAEGRQQDGRALIREFLDKQDFAAISRNNPGYGEYLGIENVIGAGSELLLLGFPLDAARMYRETLANDAVLEQAKRWSGNGDYLIRRLEEGLRAAENAITPRALAAALRESIDALADDKAASVELGLSVSSSDPMFATLRCEFQTALSTTIEAPEGIAAANQTSVELARLAKQRTDDLSAQVADYLLARATGDAEGGKQSLQRVAAFIVSHPLDEQGSDQVAIWIVAREALRDEASHATGVKLAERAVAAARQNVDIKWRLGILREWGQIELSAGNRQAAEQRWTQMLEQILTP